MILSIARKVFKLDSKGFSALEAGLSDLVWMLSCLAFILLYDWF